MATSSICPDMSTSKGVTAAWAAQGTAIASAAQRGIRRAMRSRHLGASTRMPPVANTDSPKPYSLASAGSKRSNPSTVAERAATPSLERPVPSATAATEPITRARSTLGDGRATTANPSMAMIARIARMARGSPATLPKAITMPAITARFAPDTAVRWLRPAVFRSYLTCSSSRDTSPTTRPGSSPRSAGGRTPAACLSPVRRAAATRCGGDGPLMTLGGSLTVRIADVSSPGSAGLSLPPTRTRWLGSRSIHSLPWANTTTGALVEKRAP